jgi:hypothetical protein
MEYAVYHTAPNVAWVKTEKDMMAETMRDPVTTEHMDITPELAGKWLEDFNRHNRPIMPWHWRDMAEDMKDHRFIDTGENGIRFDWDGYICGGQHTLTAIVMSGETVHLAVTRNVDPAARQVMNDALKQRFSHDLATMGVSKYASQLEALVRTGLLWDRTALQYRGHGGLATFRTTGKFTRPTLTNEWPKYAVTTVDTMEQTTAWNSNKVWPGNRGAMQFMYWLLVHRVGCNPAAVGDFFDKICYGSDDPEDRVLFLKLKQKYGEDKDKHVQVYWTIRVWNAFSKGEHLTKLQAPKGSVDERGRMILTDPYPRAVKVR